MEHNEPLRLNEIVILEGKYDKIKMQSLLDAVIFKTDGFGIYRDKELQQTLRSLAKQYGAVIITDSDAAGFQIRSFLQSLLKDCTLYHVYIPDIYGKEKRKTLPSKEGKLGVEGIPLPVLREAVLKSGVTSGSPFFGGITKSDLMELGLTGGKDSADLRQTLLQRLGLPARMSTNALLAVLNRQMTKEELIRLLSVINL